MDRCLFGYKQEQGSEATSIVLTKLMSLARSAGRGPSIAEVVTSLACADATAEP